MKRKLIIGGILTVIIVTALFIVFGRDDKTNETITTKVKKGEFRILVTTSGELLAKKSENIYGPEGLRNVRIWQVKIEDMVADGTVVDSGDWVATLDRTELVNRMKDEELSLEQLETQYTKTRLDTTLELRSARDELINLNYALEEKRIELDQSKYEPPATIRQIQIELEKSQRALDQATKNYKLKYEKARANMQDITAQLTKAQIKYKEMADILSQFTIMAPKAGMVIYKRDWQGQKQGIGSQFSVWENVVATLPNLKEMISKTYINEIDISRIKTKQDVEIGIDAFPDKKFSGKVIEVANIGEPMKNSNAKVFEVTIKVNEFDSILRPAMTTKNMIITGIIDSVLYVPIECVQSNDSISFVVTGKSRQQVITGQSNENEIIILEGLEEDDEIFLVPPEGYEKFKLKELDPAIVNKYSKKPTKKKEESKDPKPDSAIMPPPGDKKVDGKVTPPASGQNTKVIKKG